jgi:hypothetical protein
MLLGMALLWVGAVLFLNGLWLLGKIDDREIAVINVASGFITLCVALYSAFGPNSDATSIRAAALTLLFSTTYLWVAYNRYVNVDGRGLGWFSLFVAITAAPVAIQTFGSAQNGVDLWMALNWVAWAVLCALVHVLHALGLEAPDPARHRHRHRGRGRANGLAAGLPPPGRPHAPGRLSPLPLHSPPTGARRCPSTTTHAPTTAAFGPGPAWTRPGSPAPARSAVRPAGARSPLLPSTS